MSFAILKPFVSLLLFLIRGSNTSLLFLSVNLSLFFLFYSQLFLSFGFQLGVLAVTLFLLLLLFLLFKDIVELLNRTSVLVGKFLQLRTLLLLLFALANLITFLFFIYDLVHEFLTFQGRLIEHVLTLFNNLTALNVLPFSTEGQGSVAVKICLIQIHMIRCIVHNILNHSIVTTDDSQVHDIIVCGFFTNGLISTVCKE